MFDFPIMFDQVQGQFIFNVQKTHTNECEQQLSVEKFIRVLMKMVLKKKIIFNDTSIICVKPRCLIRP